MHPISFFCALYVFKWIDFTGGRNGYAILNMHLKAFTNTTSYGIRCEFVLGIGTALHYIIIYQTNKFDNGEYNIDEFFIF